MLARIDAFLLDYGPADLYSEFAQRGEQMSKNVPLRQDQAHSRVYRQEPNGGPPNYRRGEEFKCLGLINVSCRHDQALFIVSDDLFYVFLLCHRLQ